MQTETFGAGSDDQNLARAEGFRRMVEAAGHQWPDGCELEALGIQQFNLATFGVVA